MPRTKEKAEVRHIGLVKAEKPDLSKLVAWEHGYCPTPNDIWDRLIPALQLTPYEQVVLFRLFRLSFGFRHVTCQVGYVKLAKQTNMSRNGVIATLESLTAKGLLEMQGKTSGGKIYRVLPGVSMPPKGIPSGGIPSRDLKVASGGIPKHKSMPPEGRNKDKETDSITNTEVCSQCFGTGQWYPEGFSKGVARCPCRGKK